MPDDKRGGYQALYEAITLGFVFPAAIALGYVLGRWLDKTFGTYPWLSVIFTAFGIAAAFVQLFRAGRSNDGTSG